MHPALLCERGSGSSRNGSAAKAGTGCEVLRSPARRLRRGHAPAGARPPPAASPAQVAPGPAFPDPQERAHKLADLLPEVEAVFDEQFATRKAPGMAVALVVDGEVRWSKAWGQRDVGQNLPTDLDTVFRIASLTKSFTAMAVLRLRDAGK